MYVSVQKGGGHNTRRLNVQFSLSLDQTEEADMFGPAIFEQNIRPQLVQFLIFWTEQTQRNVPPKKKN